MRRLVKAGETTAARKRVYFDIRDLSGILTNVGEGSGQPQISIDGATYTNTGIGTLTLSSGGTTYYADLTDATVAIANLGKVIKTRYSSATAPETPGDEVEVVGYDPVLGPGVVTLGTAQSATSTTLVLASTETVADSVLVGNTLYIVSGTGAGQTRTITGWVLSTKTATVSRAWAVTPDNTSVYRVTAGQTPALDSDLSVLVQSGTSANQISLSSGLVSLNLAQAIPTSNTAQTLGDALNAARAQGFGPWSFNTSTKVLTLFAADGVTTVHTFNLDSATSPTSRS